MLPCHKPDGLTDELFGFDNAKVHSGITGRKKESVKRHGWRDPSGQGRVYSVFPLCRLSRRPGLKENGFNGYLHIPLSTYSNFLNSCVKPGYW
ncbi:TPA: hypothetical protein ACRRX3_002593 [Morganella morganii]|uniref:hypothetical protein n=1 Tax=Morganella morganii TaxID=582 RepID=UPI001BD955E6|nr:hypothetical protein [Morganella morganii]ELF0885886.1 hypothetical protein [Morganella morganii]MBT0389870.1 hypothetical protein [Morganella morganii subsp. morganii]HCR3196703.1 hypothetical protein [Morganella morganii]HEJ1052020.1 hypothetical protein [Morganella morganii]